MAASPGWSPGAPIRRCRPRLRHPSSGDRLLCVVACAVRRLRRRPTRMNRRPRVGSGSSGRPATPSPIRGPQQLLVSVSSSRPGSAEGLPRRRLTAPASRRRPARPSMLRRPRCPVPLLRAAVVAAAAGPLSRDPAGLPHRRPPHLRPAAAADSACAADLVRYDSASISPNFGGAAVCAAAVCIATVTAPNATSAAAATTSVVPLAATF
jgi:hypothetical protein